MHCPLMKDSIISYVNDSLIITPQGRGTCMIKSALAQHILTTQSNKQHLPQPCDRVHHWTWPQHFTF